MTVTLKETNFQNQNALQNFVIMLTKQLTSTCETSLSLFSPVSSVYYRTIESKVEIQDEGQSFMFWGEKTTTEREITQTPDAALAVGFNIKDALLLMVCKI